MRFPSLLWTRHILPLLVLLSPSLPLRADDGTDANDPYLWLEEVESDRALSWVRAQNTLSQRELEARPEFEALRGRLLEIFDSSDRIPFVSKSGNYLYNFWRDAAHPKGVWRRTSPEEYRKAEPAWETVIDVGALSAVEKENWVWKGTDLLEPENERALVELSRGGGDATVVREFDIVKKAFVTDGFVLPEAKSVVTWLNRDTLYVGTAWGPDTLTKSGYPRIVKRWRRGTLLSEAAVVWEGEVNDVAVSSYVTREPGYTREFIRRILTFFTSETHLRVGDAWVQLDVPPDALPGTIRDQLTVRPRTEWTVGGKTYPAGSLLAMPLDRFLAGERTFATLYTPGPRTALQSVVQTRNAIVLNELNNVRSRLIEVRLVEGVWTHTPIPAPEFGALGVSAWDRFDSDDYLLTVTDFLTPPSLFLGSLGKADRVLLKQQPAYFDATGLAISQHEAVSADGTRIPYFQVARKDLALDGRAPTLLYGYGGFEHSEQPGYRASVGAAWMEKGNVFVLANIRGGGEFGPSWHQAALKGNRQRAYDDFIAIAQDLIARKVTSPAHLGIQGGSNGGLLMGVMVTQRPELFGAVVCQVPLLDMRRYHTLLAGASWMAEYGDPDKPDEWEYISAYSPYQNVSAEKKYPRVLFTTSTRDDRVHPGHARKMAARMLERGHSLLYYENVEGGHGGAADNRQAAFMTALAYVFLERELTGKAGDAKPATAP